MTVARFITCTVISLHEAWAFVDCHGGTPSVLSLCPKSSVRRALSVRNLRQRMLDAPIRWLHGPVDYQRPYSPLVRGRTKRRNPPSMVRRPRTRGAGRSQNEIHGNAINGFGRVMDGPSASDRGSPGDARNVDRGGYSPIAEADDGEHAAANAPPETPRAPRAAPPPPPSVNVPRDLTRGMFPL